MEPSQILKGRQKARMSQADLASAVGVTERTIRRAESDQGPVRSVTMDRIEEVLTRRSREFTVPDSPVDPVTAAVIMAELFNVDRPMLEVLVDVAKARLARA